MLTRFRLEVEGKTAVTCEQEMDDVIDEILGLYNANREDFEITDFVLWKALASHRGRIVMKLKEVHGAEERVQQRGEESSGRDEEALR